MADPLSIGTGNIDISKWKKLTPQEILKQQSDGEEVPPEIAAWAIQVAAFSAIPDNVTYENVDGDIGIDALNRLGIEDPAKIEEKNASKPLETEEPDAIKDPAATTETENNQEPIPGQASDEVPIEERDTEEQSPDDIELTLADPALTTDPEEIRKRKERKGLYPS